MKSVSGKVKLVQRHAWSPPGTGRGSRCLEGYNHGGRGAGEEVSDRRSQTTWGVVSHDPDETLLGVDGEPVERSEQLSDLTQVTF